MASLGTVAKSMARALLLRCPRCGSGGILQTWWKLRSHCPRCGQALERNEHDHWLGGYLINFVVAEFVAVGVVVSVAFATWPDVPWGLIQWGGLVLVLGAPLLFYPFARAIWLAIDLLLRPQA